MLTRKMLAATAVAALAAAPALAQTVTATTTTDLNLRTGPGSQYDVESVVMKDTLVDVIGCYAEADWCLVEESGNEGWVNIAYLQGISDVDVVATVTAENVPTVDGPRDFSGVVAAPETMDVDTVEVAQSTLDYVIANPVDPIYLDGEIVIGAGLPETVTLYEVPDADYAYVNVNTQDVIVSPDTRRVVYIIR